MTVTLYTPGQPPAIKHPVGFTIPAPGEFAQVPPKVTALLDCTPSLVDVLVIGPDYIVYTVFDSEAEVNLAATQIVAALTDIDFDAANEDEVLRGPVLVVQE